MMGTSSKNKDEATDNVTQTIDKSALLFTSSDECRGLTAQIPETLYFGTVKVGLTCLEVSERLIAFGSNVGALFLFNRALGKFAKPLRTNVDEVINAVRIQSGEADVLAAGHKSGTLAVLRLPSTHPGGNRKMQQNSLGDIHKGREVTCLDWSPDGSKLFSADSSGMVIMTMIDFENQVFHSTFVCTESAPIVQISYALSRLAVSSELRSIVVDLAKDSAVTQIGSSDRATSGKYGIVTVQHADGELMAVTSRPKCRLWVANAISGHVDKTLIYEQQMRTAPHIPLPDNFVSAVDSTDGDQAHQEPIVELGRLYKISNELLIASDSHTISVVDVNRAKVLGRASLMTTDQLTVRSVCVDNAHGQSTVFVLLDNKRLLRLSNQPAPVEFINVPASGSAASFLSGSFLPTKTSALLNRLKAPSMPKTMPRLDSLSFSGNFGLDSLLGSPKGSFLKTSDDDSQRIRVENVISNMSEQLQAADSDSSSSVAADDDRPQSPSVDWRENVTDTVKDVVNALVDNVSGAVVDVQTGGFVTDDLRPFSPPLPDDSNTALPLLPLQPMTKDVVVTRQTRVKRMQKNGKSRDHSAVRCRSRVTSSGPATPKPEQVDDVCETESNFFAEEATRAALERMLDEHLVVQAAEQESDVDSEQQTNDLSEVTDTALEDVTDTALQVHNDDANDSEADGIEIPHVAPSPDDKLVKSQYEYATYQVLLADSSRNLDTPPKQFQSELSSGEYVMDEDLFDNNQPFTDSPRNENLDIWSSIKMAYPIVSVAATSNYILVCDSRKKMLYASLDSHEFKWHTIKETADQVATSGTGKLVWRIADKLAFALQRPIKAAPTGHKWVEAARSDIRAVALTSSAAWYLRSEGKVCVQLNLKADRPCFRIETADCDWSLAAIAACDFAVWVLRDDGSLMVRAGLKEDPIGVDWIQVCPDGPAKLVSISLYEHVGWAVDLNGDIWFIKGVDIYTPFGASGRWFQVASPMRTASSKVTSYQPLPSIAATRSGVCLAAGATLYVARGAICGHRWKRSIPKKFAALDNFSQVAVEGLYDVATDAVFLVRAHVEIFVHRLHERNLVSLPALPTGSAKIACIATNLGVLWALDSTGKLFLRTGIDAKMAPSGVEWVPVDLSQFETERITHLACSFEAVWAVTDGGNLKMCVGREQIHAAWVPVDLPEQFSTDEKIENVVAGADGRLVWIRSSLGKVWARLGIMDVLPIGQSWIEVWGLSCRDLALGSSVVWSLDELGLLHRRHGITADNPAGNYWKAVPAILSSISVTPDNRLWALDADGRLVRHQVEICRPIPSPPTLADDGDILADIDGDFEVI